MLSAFLNLLLAGVAVFCLGKKPASFHATPADSARPFLSTAQVEVPGPTNPVATLALVTNRFHWRMIESEDYPAYVANLRAVGCPEETIRDILLADIEKLYGTKVATLPRPRFWSCGPTREVAEQARTQAQRALDQEKAALVQHLLGISYVPEEYRHHDDLKEQALISFVVGPVPDGVAEQVTAIMERGEHAVQEIRSQANGILLPADEAQIQKAQEQTIAHLKGLLSPEQFEEFGARIAVITLVMGDLGKFQFSASEFREFARIHASTFGILSSGPFHLFGQDEETPAQVELFESRVKALLGESRFAEYQREKDGDFRNVCAVTEEHLLARETAVKVYEIKQLVQTEQAGLQAAAAGPEREAQWLQVQETTRSQVRRLLGDKAFESYLNHGGQWLTNFPNL